MITKESIEALKNSLDIVSIISSYLPLKRAGINFSACCPFHGEKTPSFFVSPSRGSYHCFGCGASGDAISFVMEYEKLSFAESVEKIAQLSGFSLTYTQEKPSKSPKSLFLDKLCAHYHQKLLSSPEYLDYIQKRGINHQSIQSFQLGYSGAGFESVKFADALEARKEAIELGVLGENEQRVYARFADRLMFPIHSPSGKIVGFGGRSIHSDQVAKYINSPQTPLFNKSKLLYAYHLAKESIFSKKEMIITEGYIDVIMLHQAGIKNAVATLGTALTSDHLPLLNRGEPQIIVSYDGDQAGINAAFKASKLLASEGKEGGVVIFLGGLDPADMLLEGRLSELKALLASPIPFVKFVLEQIACHYDLSNALQKEKALKESLEFFRTLSPLLQNEYRSYLASLLKLPPNLIPLSKSKSLPSPSAPLVYNDPIEVMLITTMNEEEDLLEWGIEYLQKENFKECFREYEALLNHQKEDERLLALLSSPNARVAQAEEFKEQVRLKILKDYEQRIKKIIASNALDYDRKLQEMKKLQQKIQQIKKEL